jgi:RimJ/RimL family protein N-acetyltransferase
LPGSPWEPIVGSVRIETERLILRRWRGDDAEALYAILNHPEVASWLGPQAHDDIEGMLERYEHSWDTLGYGRFAVEDATTGDLVGRVDLKWQDAWTATSDKAEVGWAIAPGRWGEALATEAARAAIDAARQAGLCRSVTSSCRSVTSSCRSAPRATRSRADTRFHLARLGCPCELVTISHKLARQTSRATLLRGGRRAQRGRDGGRCRPG